MTPRAATRRGAPDPRVGGGESPRWRGGIPMLQEAKNSNHSRLSIARHTLDGTASFWRGRPPPRRFAPSSYQERRGGRRPAGGSV
jgi:hypothetical protein